MEENSVSSYSDDFELPNKGRNDGQSSKKLTFVPTARRGDSKDSEGVSQTFRRKRERANLRRLKYTEELKALEDKLARITAANEELKKENFELEKKASKSEAELGVHHESTKLHQEKIKQLKEALLQKEVVITSLHKELEARSRRHEDASLKREERFRADKQRLQSVLDKHLQTHMAEKDAYRVECMKEAKNKELQLERLQTTLHEHLLLIARERDQLKQNEKSLEQRLEARLNEARKQFLEKKECLTKELIVYQRKKSQIELWKQELENQKELETIQLKRQEGLVAVEKARLESERKMDSQKYLQLEADNNVLKTRAAQMKEELTSQRLETEVLRQKLALVEQKLTSTKELRPESPIVSRRAHTVTSEQPQVEVRSGGTLIDTLGEDTRNPLQSDLWRSPMMTEMLRFSRSSVQTI